MRAHARGHFVDVGACRWLRHTTYDYSGFQRNRDVFTVGGVGISFVTFI